jgi:hypothetical protein
VQTLCAQRDIRLVCEGLGHLDHAPRRSDVLAVQTAIGASEADLRAASEPLASR